LSTTTHVRLVAQSSQFVLVSLNGGVVEACQYSSTSRLGGTAAEALLRWSQTIFDTNIRAGGESRANWKSE
jgi:hypothetical protein